MTTIIRIFCFLFLVSFSVISCQDTEDEDTMVFKGYVSDLDTDEPVAGADVQIRLFDEYKILDMIEPSESPYVREVIVDATTDDKGFYKVHIPKNAARKSYELIVRKNSYFPYGDRDIKTWTNYGPVFIKEFNKGVNDNRVEIGKAAYLKVALVNESQQEGKVISFVNLYYNNNTVAGLRDNHIIATSVSSDTTIVTPFLHSYTPEVSVIYETQSDEIVDAESSESIKLISGDTIAYTITY